MVPQIIDGADIDTGGLGLMLPERGQFCLLLE